MDVEPDGFTGTALITVMVHDGPSGPADWRGRTDILRFELTVDAGAIYGLQYIDNGGVDTIQFDNFVDTSLWSLNGDAGVSGDARLRLTNSSSFRTGSAFLSSPLTFSNHYSFDTTFTSEVRFPGGPADADGSGGEGMVFVIQADGPNVLGTQSNGLGLGGPGAPQTFLAIELDSQQSGLFDPDTTLPSHLGVDVSGAGNIGRVAIPRFNGGGLNHVKVEYDGSSQQLDVYFWRNTDVQPSTPTLSVQVDLAALFGGTTELWSGFMASSSSSTNRHDVLNWTMNIQQSVSNGEYNVGEPVIDGVRVFLDQNDNATYDLGEPVTFSDVNGEYAFRDLPNQTDYVVLPTTPTNVLPSSPDPFANPGFETASLFPWEPWGNFFVEQSLGGATGNPTEGAWQLQLRDQDGTPPDRETFLGLELGSIGAAIGGGLGATNLGLSVVRRTVVVSEPGTMEFDWNYLTNSTSTDPTRADFSFFSIATDQVGLDDEVVILEDTNFVSQGGVQNYARSSGYQTYAYEFTEPGVYTIGFGVASNRLEGFVQSALLLDNFRASGGLEFVGFHLARIFNHTAVTGDDFGYQQVVQAGQDQSVNEGSLVTLEATVLDPDPANGSNFDVTWSVSSDNGTTVPGGRGTSFQFTAADNGVYLATVSVEDLD
ncbi:MAG: hypothetical protein KDA60_21620, partial [Planctomycetales bacterium]|nr:hypothetical protein [Planctomycetales bacterium]